MAYQKLENPVLHRDLEWEQLDLLCDREFASSVLGVHGPPGVGKSYTVKKFLLDSGRKFSWVACDQCITVRVLLQRALREILLSTGTGTRKDAICENVVAFYSILGRAFSAKQYTQQHILVLDRIDRSHEPPLDLYSCLPRLPELEPALNNLQVIFIYSTAEQRPLVTSPVPHVYFSPYSLEEAKSVLTQLDKADYGVVIPQEWMREDANRAEGFWRQYVGMWPTALGAYTGTDVELSMTLAARFWSEFIHGADLHDFSGAYLKKQDIFVREDFVARLSRPGTETVDNFTAATKSRLMSASLSEQQKYLLCSSYLASYNSDAYDIRFFSKARDARAKRRITRPKKGVKIPKWVLLPNVFTLERMLAIFHAIQPDPDLFVPNVSVYTDIATLQSQNLISRDGSALDPNTKWKVNVPRTLVQSMAKSLELPLDDLLEQPKTVE